MATVALVGRPNVGKSTLFNKLTRRRDALVADVPGLTRDRRYGQVLLDGLRFHLIDTGGLFGAEDIAASMALQVDAALDEADLVLFLVDARAGVLADDHAILQRLRRRGLPVVLLVNKIDGVNEVAAAAEFSELGVDPTLCIAAEHERGLAAVADALRPILPAAHTPPDAGEQIERIRVALIGRPNVGKSTLTNRLLGDERQVVFDAPGTTRDAVDIPLEREGQHYLLIDTAGVRRKGKTEGIVEKFSVVKSLDAMSRAQLVLLVIDAQEGVVDQDLHLLQYAVQAGCGILLVVNKCDGLSADAKASLRRGLDRRLDFAPWISQRFISALHGTGVGHLWQEIHKIHRAGAFDVGTSVLTRLLTEFTQSHPPPAIRGRLIKLRFAHKAGAYPPCIVIHGNQTQHLPASYVRYLENSYRKALDVHGNPVQIRLEKTDNPYAGKRNELTPRQKKQRQRVISHRKARQKRRTR